MRNKEQVRITVCMGSSCFTRGNNENLDYIERLIEDKKLDIKLELSGTRCESECAIGPNIVINGKTYNNVTKNDLENLLSTYLLIRK